ncbi:MAG: preprotein translocase subunit SecE [Desulfohalobiaceae bacterium]|nr:preprotein translocase subunit SecE [Desulfohalobiaceae bacterium]
MNKKTAKKRTQVETKTGITGKLKEFQSFFQQSKTEMKKVTYPSQKQTLTTCASVLVVVFVISLFLGVVDLALSKILELVLP